MARSRGDSKPDNKAKNERTRKVSASLKYEAIIKFAVQNNDSTLTWYNIGDTVDADGLARLSPHALSGLVTPIKDAKVKEQPQRKGRVSRRKD